MSSITAPVSISSSRARYAARWSEPARAASKSTPSRSIGDSPSCSHHVPRRGSRRGRGPPGGASPAPPPGERGGWLPPPSRGTTGAGPPAPRLRGGARGPPGRGLMAGSAVCLFPGQGSQRVGMGRDLVEAFAVARRTFEEADEWLGMALSRLCFDGPEAVLQLTEHAQPAILTVSVAVYRVLLETTRLTPAAVCGHSLGEWSALVAAGPPHLRQPRRRLA